MTDWGALRHFFMASTQPSSSSKRYPFTPSVTISANALPLRHATGFPVAMPSSIVSPWVSNFDAEMTMSPAL